MENKIKKKKVSIIFSKKNFLMIPGILHITKQTYGRKKKQFYYKFYPFGENGENNPKLVAYDCPIEFNKELISKYVLVNNQYELVETIGSVNDINAFFKYQLYCNKLISSFSKFNAKLNQCSLEKYEEVIFNEFLKNSVPLDSSEEPVYSVDPKGCEDIDDAFSIEKDYINVYISNVSDFLYRFELFPFLTKRTETVYGANQNYSMLPPRLSNNYCSLWNGVYRPVIELKINKKTGDFSFSKKIIIVEENLDYDSNHEIIPFLIKETNKLNKIKKYIPEDIVDSHKAIEYLMLFFNHSVGVFFKENNIKGIYRVTRDSNLEFNNKIEEEFLEAFYSFDSGRHEFLNLENYVHASSPIRRFVDLINITLLSDKLENKQVRFENPLSNYCSNEYLEIINNNRKKVKKVSSRVQLLNLFEKNGNEFIYKGIIMSLEKAVEGELEKENVYQIKIVHNNFQNYFSMKSKEYLEIGKEYNFKIMVFNNNFNFLSKIKLMVILNEYSTN